MSPPRISLDIFYKICKEDVFMIRDEVRRRSYCSPVQIILRHRNKNLLRRGRCTCRGLEVIVLLIIIFSEQKNIPSYIESSFVRRCVHCSYIVFGPFSGVYVIHPSSSVVIARKGTTKIVNL